MSTDFAILDSLMFNGFKFSDTVLNQATFSMPDTRIKSLEIYAGHIKEETVLLSVCSAEENISKYYLYAAEADDPTAQITKATFDKLLEGFNREKRFVILISAKTIKNVLLTARISGKHCNIEASISQ